MFGKDALVWIEDPGGGFLVLPSNLTAKPTCAAIQPVAQERVRWDSLITFTDRTEGDSRSWNTRQYAKEET